MSPRSRDSRPDDLCVLVLLSAPADDLAARLPEGRRPQSRAGSGLVLLEVRLDPAPLAGLGWAGLSDRLARTGRSGRLAWRLPVLVREADGRERARWHTLEVHTAGALGTDWPRRLVGLHGARPRLVVSGHGAAFECAADLGSRRLVRLSAERAPAPLGSVFPSARAAALELAAYGPLEAPRGAPPPQGLVPGGLTLEPLLVHRFDAEAPSPLCGVPLRLDSAFRLARRVAAPLGFPRRKSPWAARDQARAPGSDTRAAPAG